ncbi:aminopeptidase PepB [Celerinatantimonas yamalensis]|uniref:Aminopeptidase PepB n=1 Tax=Celerinatantimonas yamalensis TaxID=559956 RepID=A0ABW9G5S7_9GAMM
MSQMYVSLSHQAAASKWGEGATLSFTSDGAIIHLLSEHLGDQLRTVQKMARKLSNQGISAIQLAGGSWDLEFCWSFQQGYFTAKQTGQVDFPVLDDSAQKEFDARLKTVNWARQIINQGPAQLYPQRLCQQAAELLQSLAPEHVTYQVIEGDALLEHQYVGIYEVGRGSDKAPAMLQLDYNPTSNADEPVAAALVGKGITFDSGGYSLKPSSGMDTMKSDMGGAATLTAALGLAISRGLNKRVKLFLCCAENLVSGNAFKLGDVITYRNGKTVEILNTDAEGRLVLADGLLCASDTQAPLIIDAATLTGAAKVALGRDFNAVLGFDQELVHQALSAATAEHELAWSLPLEHWHKDRLSSAFADMANVHAGEGNPGASTAAAFLSNFVRTPEQGWLHFDLSGSYQKSASDLWSTGGKGHGVRTISRLLTELA